MLPRPQTHNIKLCRKEIGNKDHIHIFFHLQWPELSEQGQIRTQPSRKKNLMWILTSRKPRSRNSLKYPINIIIDTCIISLIILAFIAYLIYYKIHSILLIIIFIISIIMLIFYQSNTLILIIAFSGFYTVYFFKLYQIIKSS